LFFQSAQFAYDNDRIRRDEARRKRAVGDTIERLLAADELDSESVVGLTERFRFPFAVSLLASELRKSPWSHCPIQVLLDRRASDMLRLQRIGVIIGAIRPRHDKCCVPPDIGQLRKTRPGRIALAACGFPIAPYSRLTRRERAALILGKITAAMRERPS